MDCSSDVAMLESSHIRSLLLAFPIVNRTALDVSIEVGEELVQAISFISERLGDRVVVDEQLQQSVFAHEEEREALSALLESSDTQSLGDMEAELSIPGFLESATLLPHQVRSMNRALRVNHLAEFSVQGAGKTSTALAAFAVWRSRKQVTKLLVIGPASCFRPWETEAERCFGERFMTIRWSGGVAQRRRLVPAFAEADLILCTYGTSIRDATMLSSLIREHPTMIVLDESHYIKNFDIGSRANAVFHLAPHARRRMILTGTPAPHSLYDLWTQFNFLWPTSGPELLGTRQQFQDSIEYSQSPAKDLREKLGPLYHRTTQDDLGLPHPEVHFRNLEASVVPNAQQRIITLLETRILAEAKGQLQTRRDATLLKEWWKARVIRLLQASSNPGLLTVQGPWATDVEDVEIGDLMDDILRFRRSELVAGKVDWTVNKVRQLVGEGKKVVIWTSWVQNLLLLERLLQDLNPLLLYGEIKPYAEEDDDPEEQSREKNIEDFRTRSDRPVLIANPAACAEAISLHKECHDAIYLDRTFNCGQFLQSLNRIHRVGLPDDVTTRYWIPILNCAIERAVDSRLDKRQQVMYEFLADDSNVIGRSLLDEESFVADDGDEIEQAFRAVIEEIERGESSPVIT